MTCDEAKPYLRNAAIPQIVEKHLAACESCRKIVATERAFREALTGDIPRARLTLPISRLWVNIMAFVLGIAIPVALVLAFRAPSQLGPEALIAHTLIVKGKVKVSSASDVSETVRQELGIDVVPPPGALEGLRFHRLGSIRAAHLVYRRGEEFVSVFVFPRSKLEGFADTLEGAKSLSRRVQEYHMLLKVGDGRVAIAFGKITEIEAQELLSGL